MNDPVKAKSEICWVCHVHTDDTHAPDCYTDKWPKGAVIKLTYLSRNGSKRVALAQVQGGLRKGESPPMCDLQLTEDMFRKLEGLFAGFLKVETERVA